MSAPDPAVAATVDGLPVPEPRSVLAHRFSPGRHGAKSEMLGLTISERALDMVLLSAFTGATPTLGMRMQSGLGLMLPAPGRSTVAGDMHALWLQPATWLVTAQRRTDGPVALDGPLAARLKAAVGDAAAVVDQSYGKCCVRLAGPKARAVLAKGCRVDLHPRAFAVGQVASTVIAHVNVTIVQIDDVPTFDVLLPATFAENTLEFLEASAAEFGYAIE